MERSRMQPLLAHMSPQALQRVRGPWGPFLIIGVCVSAAPAVRAGGRRGGLGALDALGGLLVLLARRKLPLVAVHLLRDLLADAVADLLVEAALLPLFPEAV